MVVVHHLGRRSSPEQISRLLSRLLGIDNCGPVRQFHTMRRSRRRVGWTTLLVLAVSGFWTSLASAHQGYHDTGVVTSTPWRGVTATIEVGNGSVPSSSDAFIAQRIMIKLPNGADWIEIGTLEAGWRPPQTPELYTYVPFDGPGFNYHGALANGSLITVRIESSCPSSCIWTAKVYQSGAWVTLRSNTFGTAAQYVEALTEVNTGNPCVIHPALASTPDAYVSWSGTKVKNSSSVWNHWLAASVPSTEVLPLWPYAVTYSTKYTDWKSTRAGPTTC